MIFSKIAIAVLSLADGARPAKQHTIAQSVTGCNKCELYNRTLRDNIPNAFWECSGNEYDKDFESWSFLDQCYYLIVYLNTHSHQFPKQPVPLLPFEEECKSNLLINKNHTLETPNYTCDSAMYNTTLDTKYVIPGILSDPVADSICSVDRIPYINDTRKGSKIIVQVIEEGEITDAPLNSPLPKYTNNATQDPFIGCVIAKRKNALENLITYIGHKLGCEESFSWKGIE